MATTKDSAQWTFARGGRTGISFKTDVRAVNRLSRLPNARWIGLPVRQAQHFLLSTASLSILGYEHNLVEEPAIVLWNAASKAMFALGPHQL